MNDFYIGYVPKASPALAGFVRKVIVGLGLVVVTMALMLVVGQMPFANSAFEYGQVRSFQGVVQARPFPTLLVARPGETGPHDKYSRYLLVAPGKHGADDLVLNFDGKRVRLNGQLIHRDGGTMIEIVPGSIAVVDTAPAIQETTRELGRVRVTGEIVDSKCYLGVMNPGQGKVHRDCAARCLSGGIPPIFIATGGHQQLLLVGLDGRALGRDALREFIAEPIQIEGELLQRGPAQLLQIDPKALRHTPDGLRIASKDSTFGR
ncbi:MAG: hypothetical protein WBQ64_17595 [Terriglobales bacterium]